MWLLFYISKHKHNFKCFYCRCLHRSGGCLPFQPAKCCKVVMACMRLHNLCIDNNVPIPEMCLQNNDLCDEQVVEADQIETGHTIRPAIINTFN